MPAVSEDELFTLVFLLSALLVGSVLVGYPVDWSAVFPEGDAGGSAVRLAGVLVVAGGLAAGGRLDGGVVGLLGATTAVGLMTDRARAAILGQRIRGGDELDGRSTTGGLVKLALRLALVGLATSRTDAGWALLVRLADGSSPTGGGALLVLVGTWAVSDREVRRLLGGLVQGAEEAEEEAPPESKVAALEAAQAGRWGDWSFTVEQGYFAHDDAPDGLLPAAVMPRLGLLDDSPTRWASLDAQLAALNAAAGPETRYKLVFAQRHGEGWHNRAEAFYGQARWCETFAKLYFADGMVWGPDPELTPTGLEQAADVAREWAAEVRDAGAGVVLPKVLWASPLRRAAMTLAISYGDVLLSSSGAPQPVIKENLRERLGVHTCDIRPPAFELETVYGRVRNATNPLDFVLEPGFTKDDDLWSPTKRETDESMDRRAKLILSELFAEHDDALHVALAGHGGILEALFRTTSHKACATPTGAVIPMIVKGVRLSS